MKRNHVLLPVLVSLLLLAIPEAARAQDPAVVNAHLITVKLDNSRVRVFEAVIKPGEKERMHSHPATVVHIIAGGKVRNHSADGKVAEAEFVTGSTVYRDPLTHWVENIGTTTLHVLVIELKDPV